MRKKQFLIATDGSPGALEAVEEGMVLARQADAAIMLVYIRHAPLPVLGEPYYQRALSDELAQARAILEEAAAAVSAGGVEVETEILEGNPADAIVELAGRRVVDLIILGSRGRSAVAGAVLGSVSDGVVHRANRPVLVVKPRSKTGRRAA
jgi:nucleotide-binding universal stress UspA family protein